MAGFVPENSQVRRTTQYPPVTVFRPARAHPEPSVRTAVRPRNPSHPTQPMDQPPPSRPNKRIPLVLAACLPGVLLVWWASQGLRSASSDAAPSLSGAAAPVVRADAPRSAARPMSPDAPTAPMAAPSAPVLPTADAEAPTDSHELALREPGSPANSPDPDQNRAWARAFPAAALAWLETARPSAQRVAITEGLCPELIAVSPLAAVTLAESCVGEGADEAANHLLDNMAHQWAEADFAAASAWALGRPAGATRDRVLQRVAFVQARTDPCAAARLVFETMSPGPRQNEAALSVLHQWAQQDVGAALAWAETFVSDDLRARALEEVVEVAAVSPAKPLSGAAPEQ